MITSLVILTFNLDIDAITNEVVAGLILLLIQYLYRRHKK
jgi:hypothetical protein